MFGGTLNLAQSNPASAIRSAKQTLFVVCPSVWIVVRAKTEKKTVTVVIVILLFSRFYCLLLHMCLFYAMYALDMLLRKAIYLLTYLLIYLLTYLLI